MLILFLLLSLFRLLRGAPTIAAATEGDPDFLSGVDLLPRHEIVFGTRSTSDIVTSCLATIFACTWTAIHPNIPSPADSRFNIFKRRLVTTIYALLAPEFITIWALRQYLCAKIIADEYNRDIAKQAINQYNSDRPFFQELLVGIKKWFSALFSGYSVVDDANRNNSKRSIFQKLWSNVNAWLFDPPPFYPVCEGQIRPWTIMHGFFVQMGGFMLCENGRPIQTLSFQALKDKIRDNTIKPPKISEAEIVDRSKGDVISKTVVILQTTWFISQCIARWSISIPVTELEVLTLGFAMLNGLTYALWWNKSQNVGVPVYLEMKARQPAPSQSEIESVIKLLQMIAGYCETNAASKHSVGANKPLEPMQFTDEQRNKSSFPVRIFRELHEMPWPKSFFGIFVRIFVTIFLVIPLLLIGTILRQLGKLVGTFNNVTVKPPASGDLRVPMFWSEAGIESVDIWDIAIFLLIIFATLFGCIHLVPSFFLQYSSRAEMWLWKISAAFITIQPLCTALIGYAGDKIKPRGPGRPDWIKLVAFTTITVLLPIYPVARLCLIILAILSLRDLPHDAHLTIDWISSIPHL